LAMSSTAIVAKLLSDRLELSSEHGQRVMGVLLFQDLAVVPLLVLIPALAAPADADLLITLGIALLKGAVLVGALLWGGPRVMRAWLTVVARRKSDELFMLNLLLITLGLSWLTEHAGLSLALGAFLAGMLIAETEYKHVVETDIRPFHDVLLGLFFITIGMKLDWWSVWERWGLVLLLTLLPVLAKALLVTVLARALGATPGVSLRTGLFLAQAGRVRVCVADAGRAAFAHCAGVDEPGAGRHGVVHAGHPLHRGVQRPHCVEGGGQRVDDAIGTTDPDRHTRHSQPVTCDHLWLWSAVVSNWRVCWVKSTSPTWRWTLTRTGFVKPPPRGTVWCLEMLRVCPA